jgi:phage terminase large subunit-like protein
MQCRKAMQSPASQASFLTKHLNIWIQTDQALFDMRAWERCCDDSLSLQQFEGEPCILAVDLASKTDIAAPVLLFQRDGTLIPFGRFYLPEAAVDEARNASYCGWAVEERLVLTPGNVIDFDQVEADILEFSQRFDMREIAYDPWQATQLATRLQDQGVTIIEFRQTVANFSEPTKELNALMRCSCGQAGSPMIVTRCSLGCWGTSLGTTTLRRTLRRMSIPAKSGPRTRSMERLLSSWCWAGTWLRMTGQA